MSWKDNVIMTWGNEKVSDHNRSPLVVNIEKIERKDRMLDGTMRKYFMTQKHSFSCSWENLPSQNGGNNNDTVDGGMSGTQMKAFDDNNEEPFTLTLRDGQGNVETYNVYLDEFSYDVVKRGTVDLWNVDVTLVEV